MSNDIKTWQVRRLGTGAFGNDSVFMLAEIADLRAALAKADAQMLRMATCAGEFARDACKAQAPSAPRAWEFPDGEIMLESSIDIQRGIYKRENGRALFFSAPSAPVAPIDERAEFQRAMNAARFFPRELDFSMTKSPSGKRDEYVNTHLESSWNGWQARAALSVQAVPAACADPVVELNVAMLRSRSAVGLAKYGATMADNKLPLRAWLVHALEESLDHANYLQRAMQEIDAAAPTPPTTGEA